MTGSLAEQLTQNFYRWEKRGRGWDTFGFPVGLEPPFLPFCHRADEISGIVDDGRRPALFSSLLKKIQNAWMSPPHNETVLSESRDDLLPDPFNCELAVKVLSVVLPPTRKTIPEYVEQLLLNLGACSWPLSFEIFGSKDAIKIQFACREPDLIVLKEQLHSYFPEAQLREESDLLRALNAQRKESIVIELGLSEEFMRPLHTVKTYEPDPLIGMIGALENLEPGEIGLVQVLFQPVRNAWVSGILRAVTDEEGNSFFLDDPEMPAMAREKTRRPLFTAVVRIASQSHSPSRASAIARSLVTAFSSYARPHSNEFIPLSNDGCGLQTHLEDVILRRTHRSGMILNCEELAAIAHPPSDSVRSHKLVRQIEKTKAAPQIAQGHALVLGENIHQGLSTKVSLSAKLRLRHVHIIGTTGTGKSTLLENLIIQDAEAGKGIALLDPHGDLIERVLGRMPEDRIDDVILFDPGDVEYPVGLNILQANSEIERNVLSSDLVSTFRRFSTSWGDQMTALLGNAISAFLESGTGGNLGDLRRFLIEEEFRETIVATVRDPAIVYFWRKEYPLIKDSPRSSILTRLDPFLRPKIIRNIIEQREGLDFARLVNGKKILLAKLSQGIIGEDNSYILGSLLVSKIHQIIMGRQAALPAEREPFHLYIDEFQNFITPSMTSVLSGGRKVALSLTIAHQDIRQLWDRDTTLANSVISNPGTRICFRVGDFDAQKIEGGYAHFNAKDFQNLGVGDAIVRVERAEYDFNMKTFHSPEVAPGIAKRRREVIVALSRQKYGRSAEQQVEHPNVARAATLEHSFLENRIPRSREYPVAGGIVSAKRDQSEISFVTDTISRQELSRHRYLQTLIKKMAEQRGYRAAIEEPTADGGRVDVGLERDGKRIACEISVTTGDAQELHNIEKCLRAGYDPVIVCSADKKNLEAIRRLMVVKMPPADQSKVLLFEPEELFAFLDEQITQETKSEQRIKGYRVKVEYRAMSESEKKQKREAVAQVIAGSLRRRRTPVQKE